MKKIIIKLTESELSEMIKKATTESLNEMDGATYARMYKASHRAKENNQNGVYNTKYMINGQRKVNPHEKVVSNDDVINRANKMESGVQQHWLNNYVGKTFKFYGEDRLGLVANVLFTLDRVKNLDIRKIILVGTVIFKDNEIPGDGIIIDFKTQKVVYHEKGDRYAYNLEIDNRSKALWDNLLEQLQMGIKSRNNNEEETNNQTNRG